MGLLCYKHSWLTFPALEIDKIFLIFIKIYFCCTIIPLLTILVRSSWLDMSLVLFFFSFLWLRLGDLTLGQWRILLWHVHRYGAKKEYVSRYWCCGCEEKMAEITWKRFLLVFKAKSRKTFSLLGHIRTTNETHRNRRNFKRSF